jgi:hypothetical protein
VGLYSTQHYCATWQPVSGSNTHTLRLAQLLRSAKSIFCAIRNWAYIWPAVTYVYSMQGSPAKIQHTGPWSAATWPPHSLLSPSILFRHRHLTVLSIPQEKVRRAFQNTYNAIFFILITYETWNCVTWGSACIKQADVKRASVLRMTLLLLNDHVFPVRQTGSGKEIRVHPYASSPEDFDRICYKKSVSP